MARTQEAEDNFFCHAWSGVSPDSAHDFGFERPDTFQVNGHYLRCMQSFGIDHGGYDFAPIRKVSLGAVHLTEKRGGLADPFRNQRSSENFASGPDPGSQGAELRFFGEGCASHLDRLWAVRNDEADQLFGVYVLSCHL